MAARILVVDDEPAIVDAVAYALREEGFDVETAGDGETALATLGRDEFDLLVLDLRLPRLAGIDVCRRVRRSSAIPIIMLTAKDAELDRVLGLEAGADDYVTKPFSLAELVSRVRAQLRRRELDRAEGRTTYRAGDVVIDLARHEVRVGDRQVPVTNSEFRLLTLLAREPGRVFSRREVMQYLWQSDYVGDQRACDVHVANLRRKIEDDPARPRRLQTARGLGYKLEPPAR